MLKRLFSRSHGLMIQLLVLVVIPILVTLVVVSYAGITLHEHAMRVLVADRDARAVRAAAEGLADRFAQRQIVLQVLANRLSDGVASLPHVLQNDSALKSVFDGGLVMVDRQGVVLDAWQPGTVWSSSLRSAALPWVVEHETSATLVIANARSANGDLMLYGAISLTSLDVPGTMGVMRNNPDVRLYLVADDGHILEDSAGAAVGTNASNWPGILPGSATENSAPSGHDTLADMVTASSRVPGLNWTLVTQEPWQAVVSPALRLSLIAPLAMIPALLLAVAILAFGMTRIVLPLRRLGRASTRLVWGDYRSIGQPVGGVQEIRELQTTLGQMAQRIQQMQMGMHSYIAAMLQGQEDERKRLSRELHDDTLQSLIALDQQRQMAQRALKRDVTKAEAHLTQLQAMLEQTIGNLRRFVRDVRPSYIEDLGLAPALEALCAQSRETAQIDVSFALQGQPRRLAANQELGLYRIAQEAVTNAIHHAQAARIQVSLCFDKSITLRIEDNGHGFNLPERPGAFAQHGHYGLMGMVERAEQLEAQFQIESSPGKGTLIEVCLPAPQANP